MILKSLLNKALSRMDTKQDLALYLGVSRQAMHRWEVGCGDPGAEQVWKLLRLVHGGKYHVIAPIYDAYIKDKDAAKEFS